MKNNSGGKYSILFDGLPGTGKTHFTNLITHYFSCYSLVSSSLIRKENLLEKILSNKQREMLYARMLEKIDLLATTSHYIIVDTNLFQSSNRTAIFNVLRRNNFNIIYILFSADEKDIIDRVKNKFGKESFFDPTLYSATEVIEYVRKLHEPLTNYELSLIKALVRYNTSTSTINANVHEADIYEHVLELFAELKTHEYPELSTTFTKGQHND